MSGLPSKEQAVRPYLSTLSRRPPNPTATPASLAGAVLNVAHRGASAYAPENTLAAVRKAIARDADAVEFDVHRTKDGALVLLHDATLDRTTDVRRVFPGRAPWRVSDFTHAELMQLDAGSWKSREFTGERIPTLSEALAVLGLSDVGALVELKAPATYPGIVAEMATLLEASPARVTVQSFDHVSMRDLRHAAPSVSVGVLGSPARSLLPELAEWADQVNPHHRRVDRSYVDDVHASGMRCLVWTVDRSSAMCRAVRLGVDGIITNRPDLFHRVRSDCQHAGAVRAVSRRSADDVSATRARRLAS